MLRRHRHMPQPESLVTEFALSAVVIFRTLIYLYPLRLCSGRRLGSRPRGFPKNPEGNARWSQKLYTYALAESLIFSSFPSFSSSPHLSLLSPIFPFTLLSRPSLVPTSLSSLSCPQPIDLSLPLSSFFHTLSLALSIFLFHSPLSSTLLFLPLSLFSSALSRPFPSPLSQISNINAATACHESIDTLRAGRSR
ncbi:hypothetical protein SCHPADRAFT_485657 [Schizopora paradoxa]|uniref:Transmembrane protein n=1 Tax=Schizopora paradoxa TaxID=27342 RepID=A0A0H2S2D1_9AGAM|nr:hypothetical protein SCHPADRAFT_485657 [Schizopora paradoxa]